MEILVQDSPNEDPKIKHKKIKSPKVEKNIKTG